MQKYGVDAHRVHHLIWLVATLLVLLGSLFLNVSASAYMSLSKEDFSTVTSPSVILQNGTAGTMAIYTNNTSAKVNVANATYDYVLRVNNTVADSWQIRLKKYADSNITRLQNCTLYFHNSTDGTSRQIYIQNGSYTNQTGPWHDLGDSETIYIAMTVQTNSTGTSYVYSYLEILTPTTTTYSQYIITFEIT